MLVLILMLLLGLIILGGFLFALSYFAIGIGGAIATKRRGEQIHPAMSESRRRYLASLVDRTEIPEEKEEKEAREKKDARKRYLDSLVDK